MFLGVLFVFAAATAFADDSNYCNAYHVSKNPNVTESSFVKSPVTKAAMTITGLDVTTPYTLGSPTYPLFPLQGCTTPPSVNVGYVDSTGTYHEITDTLQNNFTYSPVLQSLSIPAGARWQIKFTWERLQSPGFAD